MRTQASATPENFASFDSNGGLQDSNCNESTFIKGVKKGTETLTPVDGVVTIPSDIEGAQATSVPSSQSATATIDSNHVLQLGIPRGADAVNPFKGWYDSSSNLPVNPVVGDYAYVEDNGTTYVYRCTTEGSWPTTSSEEKEPSSAAFASAQLLNNVKIDNTHLVNPVGSDETNNPTLAKAEDVMQLKVKLEGVTAEETKVANYTLQAGVLNVNTKEFVETGGPARYTVIPVGNANRVRFLGVSYGDANTYYYGFGFYNASDEIIGTQKYEGRDDSGSNVTKEYVVDIPEGAVSLICSVILVSNTLNESNFYCYLESGDSVVEMISSATNNKIDKIESIDVPIYIELEPASGEGIVGTYEDKYIGNKASIASAPGYTVKQFPVTPGEKYYISGSTGTSSGNNLAWFINDFTKIGAGGSNNAAVGNGILTGAYITATRYEVTAPIGAIGIRIMQRDSVTSHQIKCEVCTITYTHKYNQDIIDSVGDVDDLETTSKQTIVGAINELVGEISDLSNSRKSLKVLLIGSSHGVNTISMFPVLAYHAGIDIVCGNLYTGSASIGLYSIRPAVQIPYMADNNVSFERFAVYENGTWGTKTTKTISYALGLYDWDVIILQRGASENEVWNDSIAGFYQHLLDYIKDNCDGYTPRIYFNSGLSNAYRQVSGNYTDTCLGHTEDILESAYQQMSEFGIDVIPVGLAVLYARMTCLKNTGVFLGSSNQYQCMAVDAQHLDTGVGYYVTACTLFEKIIRDTFNISVRELDYLPVWDDVKNNCINSKSDTFTQITDYYSRIAKTCAALAVIDKTYNADTASMLSTRYSSLPTTYNITTNLTGFTINNNAVTVDSDDVFMAELTVSDGYTTPVSVSVTMGGNDVTSNVYAVYSGYYAIRIGKITGDIVITATATTE